MLTIRWSLSALALSSALLACNDDAASALDVEALAPEVAEHVDVLRARIAACNARDWDAWAALHTDDVERTAPELLAPLAGPAELRGAIEALVDTFPDYQLELVDAFGSGDRLVARIHTRGTMLGPLNLGDTTVPPTGAAFEQDWVALLHFTGDHIDRIDEFYDNYGTLVQLGLSEQ
jgi:ketosteroid isomerase-like protein